MDRSKTGCQRHRADTLGSPRRRGGGLRWQSLDAECGRCDQLSGREGPELRPPNRALWLRHCATYRWPCGLRTCLCRASCSHQEKTFEKFIPTICHHTLSKNGMSSYHQIVISYQINFISYSLVCHHTNNCPFIPYRYQFIPVHSYIAPAKALSKPARPTRIP